LLSDYVVGISGTDVLDMQDLRPVQHGLFGEVGGIMSTAKKLVREGSAYPGFRRAAMEEFGDTLWYLAALCRRRGISLEVLFGATAAGSGYGAALAASDLTTGALATITVPASPAEIDSTLAHLGRSAAVLLDEEPSVAAMEAFARHYLDALHAANLPFAEVVRANLRKVRGAFLEPDLASLPTFDSTFGPEEQLPPTFRIRVDQRSSGRSYLQWKGVFIGDPLTDNISDADGYRFHDVFHFAHAAILHWSPVIRALIKHKRKSIPTYDEEQDSGRAIVVEEGLTAWLFTRAKEINYFEGQSKVSLGVLKNVQEIVSGYEVEQCPSKLWERAILQGYDVFRRLRDAEGGYIVGDRSTRTVRYEPLEATT
jgi:hypothetical protein